MSDRIYLSPPSMTGREMKYIQQAFETNWIAPLGPNVDAFEKEMCDYVGAKHALALSSGTSAIHLALRYLGVGPGDYVFCSTFTFSASCNPIMYQYAHPIFIDSERETWNMSPDALERAFHWARQENKIPKAVIIVDLYGQSADYDRLIPICEKYGVPIVEDAAEALGASYRGQKCGNFGKFGIFSFNGNKIITTSGGGMIVSDDEEAIKKMRFWATQARENELYYHHKEYGYNYRMSNICAGVGRGQLEGISKKIDARKRIREIYTESLEKYHVSFNPIFGKSQDNYWLTVLRIPGFKLANIESLVEALNKANIETRPVWKPMHLQPLFSGCKSFGSDIEPYFSEQMFNDGICLPSGDRLTHVECHSICTKIACIVEKYGSNLNSSTRINNRL